MDDEIYEATNASHYVLDAPPAPPAAAHPAAAPPADPGSDQNSVLQQSQLAPSIIENSKAPPLTSVKSTIKAEEPEEEDELYIELRKLQYKKVVAWIVAGCSLFSAVIFLIMCFLTVDDEELELDIE